MKNDPMFGSAGRILKEREDLKEEECMRNMLKQYGPPTRENKTAAFNDQINVRKSMIRNLEWEIVELKRMLMEDDK